DRLAENLLGHAGGIHVGRVEHVDARVEADVHETRGFLHIGVAPRAKEFAAAAEGARAEAERWNLESRCPELSIVHRILIMSYVLHHGVLPPFLRFRGGELVQSFRPCPRGNSRMPA